DMPPAPIAKSIDALLRLRSSFGEALYVSGSAALATQADVFGYMTQRLAASPRVPMAAVEGAHLAHDLSVAVTEASTALLKLALWPFRRVDLAEAARLP
ncbi:MAG: hypothetical protein IAI49_15390, partial [Candidatus Eremiobacteraeota bacterium]|nr:hypothetical protein [Candidatus Eremiobacteraeota bacterium]